MSCWPSLEQAPPALWAALARARAILRANSEQGGALHDGVEYEPHRVRLDHRRAVFVYADVTYMYDRELGMVFETRPGVHAAYTSRGTIAYATSTAGGDEPLARVLALEPSAGARWS